MIKSIGETDQEIISNILKLHCNGKDIELDVTYSTGGFYKNGLIKKPTYKFDINPQSEEVQKGNAENLPLENESFETIICDLPFLATTGKSLEGTDNNNSINKRFSVYPDEITLHKSYQNVLSELYRICKTDGILIFKCQDKVSSSKQYFSHCFVYQKAIESGWYPKDLFILLAKNRIVANWQKDNQKHARKFHCYYWVFQKNDKKIKYT